MKEYNIIIFKSKHSTDSESWEEMTQKDIRDEHEDYLKAVKNLIKKLDSADSDAYVEIYTKGVSKLIEYSTNPKDNFPELNIAKDGVSGKYMFDVLDIPSLRRVLFNAVESLALRNVAIFEQVSFIYKFLKPYLDGETCWLTDETLQKGIDACTEVINHKSKANELLPSYEKKYDAEYIDNVKEFRRVLKHITKLKKKNYEVYVVCVPVKNWEKITKNS